jgi:hypothetical protein
MRLINLLASADSAEGYKNATQKLLKEYGEPVIQQRTGIIPMEEGAWERLRELHGVH